MKKGSAVIKKRVFCA